MSGDTYQWCNMLRVRAWYCVFEVASLAAKGSNMANLRVALLEALEAVDKAKEAGND